MGDTTETTKTTKPPAPTSWSEGEARTALVKLRDALAMVNVTLPSLGLDHVSVIHGNPLIELGRIRPDVAEELAYAIRKGVVSD
ncbi:hypothetical protein EV284_3537 [Streptomyces sp. BK022]|uniref:hypothetical protein n=1 Tax=Streptomyces sp. BK022 TaxID=2512123 RepID=UPI001029969A|nr:hypothetical protein [Streptomyces sp. BK022]RZU36050.1 hypothetical protein EV284_3537 [Streptomyces sp. BK022]